MDLFTVIEQRRSIKQFDPAFTIPEADIKKMIEAAKLSPTSYNIQHWRFVLIQDTAQKQAVRTAAYNQPHASDASLVVLLCADIKAWDKNPERYWRFSAPQLQNYMVSSLEKFYRSNEALQRDEALRSVGMAAQTLMLAAKGLGYDSCPMIGFDMTKMAQVINLPDDHIIGMMVTIGKKLNDAGPRSGPLEWDDVVIHEKFPA